MEHITRTYEAKDIECDRAGPHDLEDLQLLPDLPRALVDSDDTVGSVTQERGTEIYVATARLDESQQRQFVGALLILQRKGMENVLRRNVGPQDKHYLLKSVPWISNQDEVKQRLKAFFRSMRDGMQNEE